VRIFKFSIHLPFYNRKKIFGPKRDEVTGNWRRLHNEELYDLYCLPIDIQVIKSRRMRWAGHVACMGDRRGAYRVLVGKPVGKPEGKRRFPARILKWIFIEKDR
jgi:hypothetical protein